MKLIRNAQLGMYVSKKTLGDEKPVAVQMTRSLAEGRKGFIYNFVHTDGERYYMDENKFKTYWVKLTYSKLPVCKIISIVGDKKVSDSKPARVKSSKSVLRRLTKKLSELEVSDCDIATLRHMVSSLIANRDALIDSHNRTLKNKDESLSNAYAQIGVLRLANKNLYKDIAYYKNLSKHYKSLGNEGGEV